MADICLPKSRKRRHSEKIEWIVVHYPAMPGCSAYKVKHYFDTTSRQVSTHFVVDDIGWLELTPVKEAAFHCGSLNTSKNGAFNGNSIGIDICDNKKCVKTISASDTDWYFTSETLKQARTLIVQLMIQYHIDIDHVCRHYDVTGKVCPRPFVGKDESCYRNNMSCFDLWDAFKAEIQIEYEVKKAICEAI